MLAVVRQAFGEKPAQPKKGAKDPRRDPSAFWIVSAPYRPSPQLLSSRFPLCPSDACCRGSGYSGSSKYATNAVAGFCRKASMPAQSVLPAGCLLLKPPFQLATLQHFAHLFLFLFDNCDIFAHLFLFLSNGLLFLANGLRLPQNIRNAQEVPHREVPVICKAGPRNADLPAVASCRHASEQCFRPSGIERKQRPDKHPPTARGLRNRHAQREEDLAEIQA